MGKLCYVIFGDVTVVGMGLTSGAVEASSRGRHEKVVVFKNCFTVEEMNSQGSAIWDPRSRIFCK